MGEPPRKWSWIRRAVVAAILGAETTIALSWLCAVVDAEGSIRKRQHINKDRIASLAFREAWGFTDITWFAIANDGLVRFTAEEGSPPYWSRLAHLEGPFVSASVFGRPDIRVEVATGWPLRALRAEFKRNAMGVRGPGNSPFSVVSGIELPARFDRRNGNQRSAALPYDAIWPGLCGDVALYAAAWWGGIAGVPALRRWRRVRGGLCPACGYDIREMSEVGCPECGWNRRVPQDRLGA